MVPEIIFLIPTRGRPEKLEACVNAIAANTDVPFHILVAFDDDPDSHDLFRPRPYVTTIALKPRHYFVRAMNRLFKEGAKRFPDTPFFVVCNDDDFFVRYGWASQVKALYEDYFPDLDGLAELFVSGRVHTYIVHRNVLEAREGVMYDPRYTQYCSDDALLIDMQRKDRYTFIGPTGDSRRGDLVSHNRYSTLDATGLQTWEAWHESDTEIFKQEYGG